MENKPEFNYFGHRLFWHELANNCIRHPADILNELKQKGLISPSGILSACLLYRGLGSGSRGLVCETRPCPFDLGEGLHGRCACYTRDRGPLHKWVTLFDAKYFRAAEGAAAEIRDLPLREDAHEFYSIIEHQPDKPKFNYRGHKLFWGKLAEDGKLTKEEALEALKQEEAIPVGQDLPWEGRFPCKAKDGIILVPYTMGCHGLCPLDWGSEVSERYPCCDPKPAGLEYKWWRARRAENYDEAKKIAAKIRDLPLSENARKIYIIIE